MIAYMSVIGMDDLADRMRFIRLIQAMDDLYVATAVKELELARKRRGKG